MNLYSGSKSSHEILSIYTAGLYYLQRSLNIHHRCSCTKTFLTLHFHTRYRLFTRLIFIFNPHNISYYHLHIYFFTPCIFLCMRKQYLCSSCRASYSNTLIRLKRLYKHLETMSVHDHLVKIAKKFILYSKKYPMSEYVGFKRTDLSLSTGITS